MAYNETTALSLLMGRLDRPGVATPAPLTEYWTSALRTAAAELTRKGIHLEDTVEDSMLVANLAADTLRLYDGAHKQIGVKHCGLLFQYGLAQGSLL